MKLYKKLIVIFLFCVFSYVIGNLIPVKLLEISVQNDKLKTYEIFQLVISIISALVTSLAVVIALFKEDIRKRWEFSKVEVFIPEENFFEVLNSNIGNSVDGANQPLESLKYHCKIEILNCGSITAEGLEMSLETLLFSGIDYPTAQSIETHSANIYWNESKEVKINLPPGGKKIINILELHRPEQQSSPDASVETIPPTLNIGGIESNPDFKNGKWIGSFAIFSTNAKPIRFKLEVGWNGRWEMRAKEMKKHLKIDLKN